MTGDGPELSASAPSSLTAHTASTDDPAAEPADSAAHIPGPTAPFPTAPPPVSEPAFDAVEVLDDYRVGWESRHASLIGRREVLTGKAKFGIFGDGKEVPQLALARSFQDGDFRSGYYRDQTLMLATGMLALEDWFSQLYADPDPTRVT